MSNPTHVTCKYTNLILDAVEAGALTPEMVMNMALNYMSEREVEAMCLANDLDFFEGEEEE